MTAPAPASDAALLQTAGSLVVLLASTYQSLDALPVGGGSAAPAVLDDHVADALLALRRARADVAEATRVAGGAVAQAADPTLAAVVAAALPTVRTPGDVVAVALTLEDVLAQTLVADVSAVSGPAVRRTCAALATEAAARVARLRVLSSLLATGRTDLLGPDPARPDLARLPAATGTVGFPDARYPVEKAVRVTGGGS